jgi:hypothetical protein
VDKTTAQQPKVQQFEFQDALAAATAETPGTQYQSVEGKVRSEDIYIYIYIL